MGCFPSFLTVLLLGVACGVDARDVTREASLQACPQFFIGGVSPRFPQAQALKARPLCYEAFAILDSGVTKTPVFVAERLNKAQLNDAKGEKRTNRFFADARLPYAKRAQLEDYKGSGWSRGHMAPTADMPTTQAMAQSFSLANMVPQAPRNNQKAWAGIEQATRKYAMRAEGDVYVITGQVFEDNAQAIGPGAVRVPKYLYKLCTTLSRTAHGHIGSKTSMPPMQVRPFPMLNWCSVRRSCSSRQERHRNRCPLRTRDKLTNETPSSRSSA